MKCLFKHTVSFDDVGVGVLDDPFTYIFKDVKK